MALPWLESMIPSTIAQTGSTVAAASHPRRMVLINHALGLYMPNFQPAQTGSEYEPTLYLRELADLRDRFTIISGVSHPDVDGGHSTEKSILTAAPHPGASSFRNTISLDQFAASRIGAATRRSYLSLSTGHTSLSWSQSGVSIPAEDSPSKVFADLFLQGNPAEIEEQVSRLKRGQSVMDTVMDQAHSMQRRLTARDREQLDQYFTSVRETEDRLLKQQQWALEPKPQIDVEQPTDIKDRLDLIGRARSMYDLMHLAIQTDSTRVIALGGMGVQAKPPIPGVTEGHHPLSHHGKDPEKIEQLTIIELEQMRVFHDFLTKLRDTQEEGSSLLDNTMVMMTSNLGNASSHDNLNLPVLFAGGPFRHGQHLAFDQNNNAPLCNLFTTMLHQMGIEADRFGSSTGTLAGLEHA